MFGNIIRSWLPQGGKLAFQTTKKRQAGRNVLLLERESRGQKVGQSQEDNQSYLPSSEVEGSTYRTRDEITGVRQERDPIERIRKLILAHDLATASDLKDIEKEVRKQVDEAIAQAKESPMPDPSELFTNVYVKGESLEEGGKEILLDFSIEEVDVSKEDGKVEAPGNPEIADFESFRNLKGAKAGADELGRPSSLRKERKASPFVSLWPAVVIFAMGQVHASAWVELEALDLPDLACLRPVAHF
ncbi:hypothetical protein AAC387_Pa08g1341 [Persea americana]